MANICDNTFYAYTEDENNAKVIVDFLEEYFDADIDPYDCDINAYFDSKWTFPEEKMEELFGLIPNKDDIYMRCLSVEYGCLYHALWVCDEDGWSER